jgi:hypothetical protein
MGDRPGRRAGCASGVEFGENKAKDFRARCLGGRTRLGGVPWYGRAGSHRDRTIGACALGSGYRIEAVL